MRITARGLDRTLTVSVADDLIDGVIDDLANDRFGEGMTRLYQDTCERILAFEEAGAVENANTEKLSLFRILKSIIVFMMITMFL